jgi:glycosyltransferase involved in cell wall biosynthesis
MNWRTAHPISVILSVYNGGIYLREAVESILCQTFKDFEFIIINDGSTDNSLEIIKSYSDHRIILLDQKNSGLSNALNIAIKSAKGSYIARMDADDISHPNRLELQYNYLTAHPKCIALGSNAEVITKEGDYIFTSDQPISWDQIKKLLPLTPFFHSSTMYSREAFNKIGGYPELFRIEDIVFFNKLSKIGELRNMTDVLLKYRLSPTAITAKSSKKDSATIEYIINSAVENKITSKHKKILKILSYNKSFSNKEAYYYYHLVKKYLWNNYQPQKARNNLLKALKIKFKLIAIFYLILSYLPGKLISKLYKLYKI